VVDTDGIEYEFKLNNVQDEYLTELLKLYWKPWKKAADGMQLYRLQGVREINLKGRQVGLSTLICALLLHDTLFFKNSKSYIFCQDGPKSQEMLRDKVKYFWESIDREDPLVVLPGVEVYNETTVKFKLTNSQIQAHTPGSSEGVARKKGRSITLRSGLLSEVAEWADAETLWQGLAPALKDPTTNIFLESSPFPRKSGPFFRGLYEEGKLPGSVWKSRFHVWYNFERNVTAFETEEARRAFVETISDDELVLRNVYDLTDEQLHFRRSMISTFGGGEKGTRRFMAEYPSTDTEGFDVNDDELFFNDTEFDVRRTLISYPGEPENLTWAPPVPGRMYLIIVDPAKGRKGDNSVIDVWDPVTRAQVFQWASNTFSIQRLHRKIYDIFGQYPGIIAIENNGLGVAPLALCRQIDDIFFQKMIWRTSRGTDGFATGTDSSKATMLYELREELELAAKIYGQLAPDDPEPETAIGMRLAYQATVSEMDHFKDLGDGKLGAAKDKKDDRIMAAAIAAQVLKTWTKWLKRFDKYYPERDRYKQHDPGEPADADDPL
jgi:hypothetical protein